DESVPQWSHQETRDFFAIRAELERDFTVAKRNKTLWEVVSSRMRELRYRRSIDQCKCKWKNLVNRYKCLRVDEPPPETLLSVAGRSGLIYSAGALQQGTCLAVWSENHPHNLASSVEKKGE
ncbi:hypothetical protein HYC85_027365, partial [Camellia sinensis]